MHIMRKAFQMEKESIMKERETAQKDLSGKCMMMKAFQREKGHIIKRKEAFQGDMAGADLLRKACTKVKLGIEEMAHTFHKEEEILRSETGKK